jgi:hypothetical protein
MDYKIRSCDAYAFARLNIETDILERPEFFVSWVVFWRRKGMAQLMVQTPGAIRQNVAQSGVALLLLVADDVFFREILDGDNRGHQGAPGNSKTVIPAKAEIQRFSLTCLLALPLASRGSSFDGLDSRFRGNDEFLELFIKSHPQRLTRQMKAQARRPVRVDKF